MIQVYRHHLKGEVREIKEFQELLLARKSIFQCIHVDDPSKRSHTEPCFNLAPAQLLEYISPCIQPAWREVEEKPATCLLLHNLASYEGINTALAFDECRVVGLEDIIHFGMALAISHNYVLAAICPGLLQLCLDGGF